MLMSAEHGICPKGFYVAMISTELETDNPEMEIKPAVDLLGDIVDMFVQILPIYHPVDDGRVDNLYVTKSYDASSHFESTTEDVMDIFQRISGEALVVHTQ